MNVRAEAADDAIGQQRDLPAQYDAADLKLNAGVSEAAWMEFRNAGAG